MNIRHLQYLIEIARCGSINQATQNLYISQPTLSGIIKRIEGEMGYSIFETGPFGSTLTPEGELFIRSAENIVSEIERMYAVPTLMQKDNSLSICCSYSSSMMKLFLNFSNKCKGERQDRFKETGIHHALRDAITHAYRLTYFYAFDQRIQAHKENLNHYGFKVEKLSGPVPICCMISGEHELKFQSHVNLDDLKEAKLVCYEDFAYEDWLGPMGVWTKEDNDSTHLLNVFDRGGLVETILSENYVAIVPSHPHDPIHFKNLFLRPLLEVQDKLHWYLTYPADYKMNSREKQFHHTVRSAMAEFYPDR